MNKITIKNQVLFLLIFFKIKKRKSIKMTMSHDNNDVSDTSSALNELCPEVVNKVNELIGMDRSLLSSNENANEIVNKLRNKIDALRDNFVVSIPCEVNNQGKFGNLCGQIESLADQYVTLKADHAKIRTLIDEYKRKSSSSSSSGQHDEELRNLIAKCMSVQRYLIYVRTLIKIDELSSLIDSHLAQLSEMKERAAAKAAVPDLNTPSSVLNQLGETEKFIRKLVELYKNLINYSNEIVATKCVNLSNYIQDVRSYYFEKVKLILSK